MYVDKITDAMRQKMLRKSAEMLPNSPSKAGWTPQTIRNSLFQFVTDDQNSIYAEVNRIVEELNPYIAQIAWDYDIIESVESSKYYGKSGFVYKQEGDRGLVVVEYAGAAQDATVPRWAFYNGTCYVTMGVEIALNATASTTLHVLRFRDSYLKIDLVNAVSVPISSVLDTIFFVGNPPTPANIQIPSVNTIFVDDSTYAAWEALNLPVGDGGIRTVLTAEDVAVYLDQEMTQLYGKLYGGGNDYTNATSPSDFYKARTAIGQVASDLSDEITNRANSVNSLIDTLWGLSDGGTYYEPADGSALDLIYDKIDDEATLRANGDTTLQGNIDNEALARSGADTGLSNRITANKNNIDGLALRMQAAEGDIDGLSAELKGYSRGYTCATFSDFASFLAGGSGVKDKDGNSIDLDDLTTGDMIYVTEENVPDFWWQVATDASSTYAETYEYNNVEYELYAPLVGYAHKVEIDDSALIGYTQAAQQSASDAHDSERNAASSEANAAQSAYDAQQDRVAAEAAAQLASSMVQNGAYIRFEVDLSDGQLYIIKTGADDFTFELDQDTGMLYLVEA